MRKIIHYKPKTTAKPETPITEESIINQGKKILKNWIIILGLNNWVITLNTEDHSENYGRVEWVSTNKTADIFINKELATQENLESTILHEVIHLMLDNISSLIESLEKTLDKKTYNYLSDLYDKENNETVESLTKSFIKLTKKKEKRINVGTN